MLLIRGNLASASVNRDQELTILQPCPILVSDEQQLTSCSFWPVYLPCCVQCYGQCGRLINSAENLLDTF